MHNSQGQNYSNSKHIHILGICGTFMGGVAMLARAMGFRVTGSDINIYPPMSTFLAEQGIEIIPNFEPSQLEPAPHMTIVGNALSRGNPCVEYLLANNLPYTSGAQWLHDNLLWKRKVLAVAGTHGKTTTTGMLSWILDQSGIDTGFLVGGISGNFGCSARLGSSEYFVIEADEYDTAFFDKRSKFVHYNPYVAIINNLSFDHADIFANLAEIQRQFHHLVRIVSPQGLILSSKHEKTVQETLAKGCWSNCQYLGEGQEWEARNLVADCSQFEVYHQGKLAGKVEWQSIGKHNMHNALMAISASHYVGVPVEQACDALGSFVNVKRRLEIKGVKQGITLYDDFAHHPEAIEATLEALRTKVGQARILAVLEPRSNTMKLGVHKQELAPALHLADKVFFFQPDNIPWSVEDVARQCSQPSFVTSNLAELAQLVANHAQTGDHILVMSNGNFGGIHSKILELL